jgi:hypothetical protein
MNAEQLFTRPPSPVPGQPPSILHPASCMLYRPRPIVNRPFSTFQPSNFPPFKTARNFSKLGLAVFIRNVL